MSHQNREHRSCNAENKEKVTLSVMKMATIARLRTRTKTGVLSLVRIVLATHRKDKRVSFITMNRNCRQHWEGGYHIRQNQMHRIEKIDLNVP